MNKKQQESLNLKCLNDMKTLMQKRNQKVTKVKEDNWYEIFKTITKQLYGKQQRSVIPLEAGGGKSTAIGLWVSTWLHSDQANPDGSLIVAVSSLNELNEIYSNLMDRDVSHLDIGVFHSSNDRKDVVQSDKDITSKRVVLTTHQMVKKRGYDGGFNFYKGKHRSLMLWDECCISSQGFSMRWRDYERLNDNVIPQSLREGQIDYHYKYMGIYNLIESSLQKTKGEDMIDVISPPVNLLDRKYLKGILNEINPSQDVFRDLNNLLSVISQPFIVELDNKQEKPIGLLSFCKVLDERFNNMVIFNASHSINPLEKQDPKIKEIKMKNNRSYKNVNINTWNLASGKDSIETALMNSSIRSKYLEPICDVLKNIPEGERAIIFYRKPSSDKRDIKAVILKELEVLGVNVSEKVGIYSKYEFVTWGNHKATNSFSDCKHIVMVGQLNRDPLQYKAELKGQSGSLKSYISDELVNRYIQQETAQEIYQAILRGVIRTSSEESMNVYMTLPMNRHGVLEALREVMPDFQHKDLSEYQSRLDKMSNCISAILEEIREMQVDKSKGISVIQINRKLKEIFTFKDKNIYTKAHEYFREISNDWIVRRNTYYPLSF